MKAPHWLMVLCLFCLQAPAWAAAAQPATPCPTLDASNAEQRASLMRHVCFLVARPGQPAHEAASPEAVPAAAAWTATQGAQLAFRDTRNVYWLRLNLVNTTVERDLWYLKLSYPQLDEVTFWKTDASGTTVLRTGDHLPYLSRLVDYRYFLLPVKLDAGDTATITIRVHTTGAITLPLTLQTPDELVAESNHLTLSQGLFYGALLIFALFNLLLYVGLRIPSYLYNSLYLFSLGLFLFTMNGFAFRYFWPNSPTFGNLVLPSTMALGVLALAVFARSFLEVQPFTRMDKVLLGLIAFSGVMFLQVLLLPYDLVLVINVAAGVLVTGTLTVFGLIRWQQGYMPAKWYTLAGGGLFAGATSYTLAAFDLLPSFLPRELFLKPLVGQAAIGAQVLLLNYALAQRWQLVNRRLLEVEQSARSMLEAQVAERTADLSKAMLELKAANRKLMSQSIQDALTGLHNRRYLDELLPGLCAEARRTGRPLSVAIVDADHFKRVNDRWGHPFGDTCLKHIAQTLTRHAVRPRDKAVRFGGEEFALLLPETSAGGALQICNAMLGDIASRTLLAPDGTEVTITLSAGIATLTPDEDGAGVFQRADEALYEAKRQGRNRAVVSTHDTGLVAS